MSMREKKKSGNGRRKPYTKPAIKREALEKLNPFSNAKLRPDEELDRGLKQKGGPYDSRRQLNSIKKLNLNKSLIGEEPLIKEPWKGHMLRYDPKTGRVVPRDDIDLGDYDITPRFTVDEKQREMARKIYTKEWEEFEDEEKGKVPFLSRLANGKAIIQRNKERVARELGKDVEDVTDEDIRESFLAYWHFNSKSEPERVDLKEAFSKARDKTGREAFWSEPTEEDKKKVIKLLLPEVKEKIAGELEKDVADLTYEDIRRVQRKWVREGIAKQLGKDIADLTTEDIVKALSPFNWNDYKVIYDPRTGQPIYGRQKPDSELPNGRTVPAEELAERREPEKKKEKTPHEKFNDFMREKPKDSS